MAGRLSVKAMTVGTGLLWGGAILSVGILHRVDPSHGVNFLGMTSSLYPGLPSAGTAGSLAIGTIEGLIDGGISGFLLALLYSYTALSRGSAPRAKTPTRKAGRRQILRLLSPFFFATRKFISSFLTYDSDAWEPARAPSEQAKQLPSVVRRMGRERVPE